MYLEHFGLAENPFGLSPKLDYLYRSGTFEESMAHLIYGLDNQEAIVLITGQIGTGKTMAIQSFLSNLGPRFEFALVTNTRVTGNELLKLVLEDLDVEFRSGSDKSDLLILFKDFLHDAYENGKRVLLVIDEAQNLAPEVLEEIRLLTNLGQGDVQPVQIILVGQPELEDTVNRHDLAQIRQRIRVHYNLDPMSRKETEEYLDHRMAVAGCKRKAFSQGAVDLIHEGGSGIPRLVNTLAGEALLSAFVGERDVVQPEDVEIHENLRRTADPVPVADPVPRHPVARTARTNSAVPRNASSTKAPHRLEPDSAALDEAVDRLGPVPESPPERTTYSAGTREQSHSRPWNMKPFGFTVVALVVFGALYAFGYLDGVIEGVTSRGRTSTSEPAPREVQDEEVPEVGASAAADEDGAALGPEISAGPESDPEETVREIAKEDTRVAEENSAADPSTEPTTPVATEEQAVQAAPTSPVAGEAALNEFFIHIYSFRTPDRANSLVRRWDHPEDSLSIVEKEVRGVTWHRVYLGPYPSRDAALMVALRLEQDGYVSYFKVVDSP